MISVDEFRASADAWLAEHRREAPPDYGAILPPELHAEGVAWQRLLHGAGFAAISWPEAVGGRGLTPAHEGEWITACAHASVPPFLNMVGLVLAGRSILAFGTPDQQTAHMPRTARGDVVWCQLFSEPGAGSDLASLATSAVLDGDQWVLNGQKVWCSNGRVSDWGICLARTEAGVAKHKGISFFLVDMHTPGVEVRPLRQITGGSEFDEVFLTDVRLPADSLLGERGQGWTVAMATLTNERGHIGASGVAMSRRLDSIAALGGDGLSPVERDELAELWIRGKAYLAMAQGQGPTASIGSSLAKLGMTELLYDTAMLRGDLAGADAMLDGDAALGMLGSTGGRIAGGTSQVQRNIIGERILGLPREPR